MQNRRRKNISAFGQYLTELRKAADLSLDEVVALAKRRKTGQVSKSALSLYERGEIKNPNPEMLQALAAIYQVPFEELAQKWFNQRFSFAATSESKLTLPGAIGGKNKIELVLPAEHVALQAKLEPGSEVAVCAVDFIEDKFFDLVLKNIKRGVRYHHLVPEDYHSAYRAFVSKLEAADPTLVGQVDRKKLFFSPRTELDFPISYVLYLHKNGQIEGFIALPLGSHPQCYERATETLSWKLYQSFHWSLALAKEQGMRKALSGLYLDVKERVRWQKTASLIELTK